MIMEELKGIAKILIYLGALLMGFGILFYLFGASLPLGRLPGDIYIEREGFRFYFPITSGILVSIALSLILWFFRR